MNPEEGITAFEFLKSVTESDLVLAFSRNSDLPKSKTLAKEIKKLAGRYSDSEWLDRAVEKCYPKGVKNKPQMMARIFQAIRIEVNQEKDEIETGITGAVNSLLKGGRLLVISFHSAEDRWVKKILGSYEKACICPREFPVCTCGGAHQYLKKVVKKPLVAGASELKTNSRARSAKLRVMEKIVA